MATTTDFVGSVQDQWVENIRRSQKTVLDALGLWAESVERLVPDVSSTTSGALPTPEEVVDNTFDFAERLLGAQRSFAKSLLKAGSSVVSETRAKASPQRQSSPRTESKDSSA
jgi:hypothetical protein